MASEDEPDMGNAEDAPGGFGFAIPVPPEMAEALGRMHDRAHMHAEARTQAIYSLLDRLPPDDLLTLRDILRAPRSARNRIDGQVVSIMRVVHHVDPYTARPELEGLADGAP